MGVPNNHCFPTKNDNFGLFYGCFGGTTIQGNNQILQFGLFFHLVEPWLGGIVLMDLANGAP